MAKTLIIATVVILAIILIAYLYLIKSIKVTTTNQLNHVVGLVKAGPLKLAEIGSATELEVRDEDSDSIYYEKSASDEYGTFQGGEYRKSGNLLILTLAPGNIVTKKEIRSELGKESEISIPSPEQSANPLVYLVYPRSWGSVKFGFAQNKDELVDVIFHYSSQ